MSEINWSLFQPVDIGAQVQQGFAAGQAMVEHAREKQRHEQARGALEAYMRNPNDERAGSALAFLDPQMYNTAMTLQANKRQISDQAFQRSVMQTRAVQGPDAARQQALVGGDPETTKALDALDENQRAMLIKAGELIREFNPTDEASFQQARQAAAAAGMPLTNVPPHFDAPWVSRMSHIADALGKKQETERQGRLIQPQPGGGAWEEGPDGSLRELIRPYNGTGAPGTPVNSAGPAGPSAPPAAAAAVGSVLTNGGIPPHVAAGFLGNFKVEGGYGGASGDGGSASGIAQWHGDRQAAFERVTGKPISQSTPEEQAKFVLWEMHNPEAAGMTVEQRDAILHAPDAATAASLIDQHYERSSGQHRDKRVAAATSYAGVTLAPPVATHIDGGEPAVRAAAARAIAAGKDPEVVRKLAAAHGVIL